METKTIRKLRIRIIPYVFLLYIVAYLDRINIGFAALTMNKELAITSQQFGLLVGIFFFGYFLFEIPSNLLLHRSADLDARILISRGIVATVTGLVQSLPQLYVARFLLGLAEAGFFPGIVLYLTYWFRQREQAEAIGLFLAGLPVYQHLGGAGFRSYSGSGALAELGVSSWRWLLILEGIPAVACGLLTYFLLASRPAEAKFLTPQENIPRARRAACRRATTLSSTLGRS